MKVLCIGQASYDISMRVNKFPKENSENRLKEKVECAGGPALIAASLLGSWDVEVYFTGVIGNDIYGEVILEELKKRNVNYDYVVKLNGLETIKTFIIINKENASRTLFNVTPKIEGIKPRTYNFEPDVILMDGDNYSLALDAIEKYPSSIKVMDACSVTDETDKLCKKCDYIICTKDYAELITKERIDYNSPDTLKVVINKLESLYRGQIIITQEEKGCLYKIDDKIKMMSGLKVFANDTTGAGDIFHGAFVYGITKSLPLEKCLKIANIAAGLSVKKIGSSNSIPQVEEVYKIYEKNR